MRQKNMLNAVMTGLLLAVTLTACKKNDVQRPQTPVPPESEEEVITTVEVTFTDIQTGAAHVLHWVDLDGTGGNDPVITTAGIPREGEYTMNLRLLNQSVSPAQDLTAEIGEEDDEHQLFFAVNGVALAVQYADLDGNGHPVGLLNMASTGAAGTGTMVVTLRHQPDKGAPGVAQGDITHAGGETDIEVTFPIEVL